MRASFYLLCDYTEHSKYYKTIFQEQATADQLVKFKAAYGDNMSRVPIQPMMDARRCFDFGPHVASELICILGMTRNGGIRPYYRRPL